MRRATRKRRLEPAFNLSFLDSICCGFGAIILLLVLTKIGEPGALEQAREDLGGLVARLEAELNEIRGETESLSRELPRREEQLSDERERIARLRGDLSRLSGQFAATRDLSEVHEVVEGRLVAAQQELTEEMKRLAERELPRRQASAPVGGIPVDSEYIIFVIDTSGSMVSYAWPLVRKKMEETLDIYPRVRGIQVMSDMGQYMFRQYADKWIPDTPARRQAILERLAHWQVFSNSSPVEGIVKAIETFASAERSVSIYVLGDEFTGTSIDEVVKTVRRLNRPDKNGRRPVRIHGIGFPVMFSDEGLRDYTGVRFASLMRVLCHENGGTFVGLNALR